METISWADFEKIEIRTGTIIEATEFPEAKKPAFKLQIDFGPALGIRKTSAQITALYKMENLVGMQVVAVVNFPPKQIGKYMSECLVLGSVASNGDVTLLQPEHAVQNGLRIS